MVTKETSIINNDILDCLMSNGNLTIIILLFFVYVLLWKILFWNKKENDKYAIVLFEISLLLIWILTTNIMAVIIFGVIILLALKKDWFMQVSDLIYAWTQDCTLKFLENHHKGKQKIKEKSETVNDSDLLPSKTK